MIGTKVSLLHIVLLHRLLYLFTLKSDSFEKTKEKQNRGTWNALIIWEAIFCLLTSTMGTALGIDISFKKNEQVGKFLPLYSYLL